MSGSLNMVTIRPAEGFSPPTTRGTRSHPPQLDAVSYIVGLAGQLMEGGGAMWMQFSVY